MLNKEDKQNVAKVKKLIRTRDLEKIEMGIELVRSINNPYIFDELLGNVEYSFDQWSGTFNHDWKGTGPDQYYFQIAILGLINFAPKGSNGYEIRDSVKILKIKGEESGLHAYEKLFIYAKYLSNFSNLTFLKLERFKEIIGFEEIYSLPLKGLEIGWCESIPNVNEKWGFKNLEVLHMRLPSNEVIDHVDYLSNLTTIENLKLSASFGAKSSTFSIDGLKKLKNLKFLYMYGLSYSNLDAISSLKNLNYVHLSGDNLVDISGLTTSKDLEFINLSNSKNLKDISHLSKLKNIKLIDVSSTQITSLKGLENCIDLHGLNASHTPIKSLDALVNVKNIYGINLENCSSLENIEGLMNSSKLKELILSRCSSLKSLSGLEKCINLRVITLSGSGILNLDPLINCKNIFHSKKTRWNEDTDVWSGNTGNQNNPFWGITISVDKVGYGNLYQAKYIGNSAAKYYHGRSWDDPVLNEFSISDCPNLQSVEGLKNSGIQILVINNCPNIISIDYLLDFPLLQCCDFTDCTNLESVESLSSITLMDRLILKKCYKVKPKPRFLMMDSFEKINDYLSKFRKKADVIKLNSTDQAITKKLENLLLSNDYSNIELGLELANSISNNDIFDFLLEDVKFIDKKIIPNGKFLGNNRTKEFRDFALQGLISIAPDSCKIANQIKESFIVKSITGSNLTSLLSVSGFNNLEELSVNDTNISTISDLSRLKRLKKLELIDNPALKNLSGIKGLINLEYLSIKNCKGLLDLNYIEDFKKLKYIEVIWSGITTTNGIKKLPVLKNIKLNNNSNLKAINDLAQIDSLESVTVSDCPNLNSLDPLTKLPNLNLLKVQNHNIKDIEGISSLIKPLINGLRKE